MSYKIEIEPHLGPMDPREWDNLATIGGRLASPSRTTSKHLKEMGVENFEVLEEEALNSLISDGLKAVCREEKASG